MLHDLLEDAARDYDRSIISRWWWVRSDNFLIDKKGNPESILRLKREARLYPRQCYSWKFHRGMLFTKKDIKEAKARLRSVPNVGRVRAVCVTVRKIGKSGC